MVINIYLPPTPYKIITKADIHIGVESGALFAIQQKITLDRVISDFDSISKGDYETLEASGVLIEKYPSKKDETDAALAVLEALKYDPQQIYLYTGLGTRADHLVANLLLLQKGPITLINDSTKAYVLNPGSHEIKTSLDYISFFAISRVKGLDLKGFKYELENALLEPSNPLGISNEGSGTVYFKEGTLLVIESKD